MSFKHLLLFAFIPVIIFSANGCGSKSTHETASVLNEDDLKMLARLDGDITTGNAQAMVEVIQVPIPPQGMEIAPPPATQEEMLITSPEVAETNVKSDVVIKVSKTKKFSFEEKVQVALKLSGFYKGSIDGKVGPGTRTAIKAFQKDNDLKADGMAGANTWLKLEPFFESWQHQ